MDMWLHQVRTLMDYTKDDRIVLVGHSLSASFALKTAARDPRVSGVVATAPFGISYQVPADTKGWTLPLQRDALRSQVERTVYNPNYIDDSEIDLRWATLSRPGYRDYFTRMYPHGRQYYLDASALNEEELAAITCPVVLMHGANDVSFGPEKTSLVLARKIPSADVMILNRCGHSIALEYPEKFISTVNAYFG
jgi:2-hydroxymuconate-semialdehyde hydrolase